MALYTTDSIDRLKGAIDMLGLVGARTDLRRVGSRHTGLCPFHDERTPSFSVNAELGLYHCFGCGASGDAIRFVQSTEGLDFREAVELLADRYGVELKREEEDPRAEERRRWRERLLKLLERAAAFYARYLWESEEAGKARAYLAGRELGEQVLRDFRVGYSPSAWDRLLTGAQRDGFKVEEIAAAGLGQRGREGGLFDRFRGRIMFPLADARGRVLGFGARALREDQRPKYLNTSENELYHKGRQLFGIDRARGPAAKTGRVIVVEGYTDVLALHQAGVAESVAIMGTALTQEQIAELARAATTVYLALDADRSGQEAMLRAARAAVSRGVELRVVALPEGRDPAELVARDGAEAFGRLCESALTVSEFEARRVLAAADLETPAGRDHALGELRPLIASLPPRTATRDELVRYVADRLDVPTSYLLADLSSPGPRTASPPRPGGRPSAADVVSRANGASEARPGPPETGPASQAGAMPGVVSPYGPVSAADVVVRAERAFLAQCVARPGLGRDYLARLSDEHLSSGSLQRVRDHLRQHLAEPMAGVPSDDPALTALVGEIVMLSEEEPASDAALRLGFLQLELRRLERALRSAREAKNFAEQRGLWGAREAVRGEMEAVMGEAV